ncbi:hypothetical protein AJ85_13540 [Alkalihalobacillus alcalophilus ATCC 27647 = CGMCC 1.3604]|uniref:Transporter n=1 Tax=Alkalihalobacillus alcalophilus ATCC 27647 = CGMCC 1.3604 TaxID=1218173 RepID=A0A094WQ02_ALKAL|nr:hypothetical protein [Alkalihalobacillus alcalophilus]KGA98901.1 hypothetical protein BALCAV_0202160 [Alkalihalobacillus alcalophilus ATCC 27647 = CGMCC 1.3604]MED1560541.1 hypothetical protein [Alkalihalobacillus alcalophilus]THG90064.1 hypothetical protein AJ85_13540 [Alkalihalobacillus alcalophilus ATCC 27647 = CGMCC 1.3604]
MHNQRQIFGNFPPFSGLGTGGSPFFGGGSFFPPFGPGPGGSPSAPPPFGPGPGGPPPTSPGAPGSAQPPTTPPPDISALQASGPTAFAVDPGGLRGCLFRFTFIRLNNGDSFWFYPTFIGRTSVAGFRWSFFRWVYFGIDTRRISSFQCV